MHRCSKRGFRTPPKPRSFTHDKRHTSGPVLGAKNMTKQWKYHPPRRRVHGTLKSGIACTFSRRPASTAARNFLSRARRWTCDMLFSSALGQKKKDRGNRGHNQHARATTDGRTPSDDRCEQWPVANRKGRAELTSRLTSSARPTTRPETSPPELWLLVARTSAGHSRQQWQALRSQP